MIHKITQIEVKSLPNFNFYRQKTLARKRCSCTAFSLYIKNRGENLHAAKPNASSLHSCFGVTRFLNFYLTTKIIKCEQILKNTREIFRRFGHCHVNLNCSFNYFLLNQIFFIVYLTIFG